MTMHLPSPLVQPVDAGVQWEVNMVKFLYQMKHNSAVTAITRRIDAVREKEAGNSGMWRSCIET